MIIILICLSVLLISFLIMISVQLLKIEKVLTTLTLIAEKQVKQLYGK